MSSSSLFRHEKDALDAIEREVKTRRLGRALGNLDLHDAQSNRYFETDMVLVAPYGVYVVELKHWSGTIDIRPNSWLQGNSFFREDPHRANSFKAKLLKGVYEYRFPHFPSVFVESVVVLTNPEASVQGASGPNTDKHNPTLQGVDELVTYLKRQRRQFGDRLTLEQVAAFADCLETLRTTAAPRDFAFPGYEIVDRLSQHADRAEVIARRRDVRHRQLSRLRIFFPAASGEQGEREAALERATATLNAVAKVGEHPNILKVWSVPNENGYVVEGSDWSETGTLCDVISDGGPLEPSAAEAVTAGILRGLAAIHSEDVIHRALSPDSILMVGGTPKLTNFDLSYQLEDDRTTVIPDTSRLVRSPFIAPEVYRAGPLTESADLFSVGVILYQMLTGERPFSCSTDLERTDGMLGEQQRNKVASVDARLAELVGKLILLQPKSRIGQAFEVLDRLERSSTELTERSELNAQLEPGTRGELYEIETQVGAGSQAQVYSARGPHASRVAVKLFNVDTPLERIVREQELAAAVRDPGVVEVKNFGQWRDGRFYIAFEWLDGDGLRGAIQRGERPDEKRFVRIAERLLGALSVLHDHQQRGNRQPILHNDIKPENVIIADHERPVLIDFGSASGPHIGLYEGTEGYVAPDLRLGQDRNYCEDGDLYALGVTLYEWLFGALPGSHTEAGTTAASADCSVTIGAPVLDWLHRAVAPESENRFATAREMRDALLRAFEAPTSADEEEIDGAEPGTLGEAPAHHAPGRVGPLTVAGGDRNPFVSYLNSLQCIDASSENALAESQARNEFFALVHVPHPVAATIEELLTASESGHVILTGHAGDGKSTVALHLYKRLVCAPVGAVLDRDLRPREDIQTQFGPISIIKDLSEFPPDERIDLIRELVAPTGPRFLLVSNTGTMLDAFRDYAASADGDPVAREEQLLQVISGSAPGHLEFHGKPVSVINLSMSENLGIAEELFGRVLDSDRWIPCERSDCSKQCPIFRNVKMMQDNATVIRERLFLAYRRVHEYGTRLTLRQLSAHLAYMVTAGLRCSEVADLLREPRPNQYSKFAFFNRFFGDDGGEPDRAALQLRAVRAVRAQGFGMRLCPTWERRLWLQSEELALSIEAKGCADEFDGLRDLGVRRRRDEHLTDALARREVRRMLFFLHQSGTGDVGEFTKTFLNSPMILDFAAWQAPGAHLSLAQKTDLERSVFHVLQEQFTGVRLPENVRSDRRVFITLSRRRGEVRQSAQVVLASFPEDDFDLHLAGQDDGAGGHRHELVLSTTRGPSKAQLPLGLPFLDYVMMRHRGEVGGGLQPAHVDRIEKFKSELLRASPPDDGDDMVLVRLRTNHTFRKQVFAVHDGRVEVTDG